MASELQKPRKRPGVRPSLTQEDIDALYCAYYLDGMTAREIKENMFPHLAVASIAGYANREASRRAMQNEKGDSFEPPAQSSTPGEVHAAANEGDDTSSCPKSA